MLFLYLKLNWTFFYKLIFGISIIIVIFFISPFSSFLVKGNLLKNVSSGVALTTLQCRRNYFFRFFYTPCSKKQGHFEPMPCGCRVPIHRLVQSPRKWRVAIYFQARVSMRKQWSSMRGRQFYCGTWISPRLEA